MYNASLFLFHESLFLSDLTFENGGNTAVTRNLQVKIDLAKSFMPYSITVFFGLLGCEIPLHLEVY